MSCVIGLVTKDGVLLASDSAASDGNILIGSAIPKVFVIDGNKNTHQPIGFGITGVLQALPALRFGLKMPVQPREMPSDHYVINDLGLAIRNAMHESGAYDSIQAGGGCDVLLAYGGNLYFADSNGTIVRPSRGYDAVGSGREVALGALGIRLAEHGMHPNPGGPISGTLSMEDAVDIAEEVIGITSMLTVFCAPPIILASVEPYSYWINNGYTGSVPKSALIHQVATSPLDK